MQKAQNHGITIHEKIITTNYEIANYYVNK